MDDLDPFAEPSPVRRSMFDLPEFRTCVRKGCARKFPVRKNGAHMQMYCSPTCRQRAYWDSGRGRARRRTDGLAQQAARKVARAEDREARYPEADPSPPLVAPRVPLVNTHVAGSVARALLYGDTTYGHGGAHSRVGDRSAFDQAGAVKALR